mmetsp:Transcript_12945/g.34873  ORF Transcript_12945/g.34873 Transcript_12945/m.34873 type:complete len:218 (-) Transcript_12945:252-905(-)
MRRIAECRARGRSVPSRVFFNRGNAIAKRSVVRLKAVVGVDEELSAERLGEQDAVAGGGAVGEKASGGGDERGDGAADDGPRVEHGLAASDGHASEAHGVAIPPHHCGSERHARGGVQRARGRHGERHHARVRRRGHARRVQIRQHVCRADPPHEIRVVQQRVEKVVRRDQRKLGLNDIAAISAIIVAMVPLTIDRNNCRGARAPIEAGGQRGDGTV